MSAVIHCANNQEISVIADNPHFLLTNNHGDYLALGMPNTSNYHGYFKKINGSYFKILHSISPVAAPDTVAVDDQAVSIAAGDRVKQDFLLLDEGMLVHCSGRFLVTLDCKKLYDESDQGRVYSVDPRVAGQDSFADLRIVNICYTKYAGQQQAYVLYVCMATTMQVGDCQRWRAVEYSYDVRRGTASTVWVYDLLLVEGDGVVSVAVAHTQSEAQRRAVDMIVFRQKYRLRRKSSALAIPVQCQLAWRALSALQTDTGVMAGLPWFYQEWSRDELISCGGLLAARKYDAVLHILEKWYGAVRPDGTLAAIYPDRGIESSDAPGWLCKRTRDLLVCLSNENLLYRVSQDRLNCWRESSGRLFDRIASKIVSGLVYSEHNTTWMDTAFNDDGRAGFRIELQALFLALYDCYAYLSTITRTPVLASRQNLHRTVLDTVHLRLVVDGKLLDGLTSDQIADVTARPNIFLAWYIAPKMFENHEWARFFRAALPSLWCEWKHGGGLASIAKDHPNFHSTYSGESVASYHRGDSWYFINNIAAMALYAVCPGEFEVYIRKILDASMHDLLALGFVGNCSELSSAERQEAAGCYAQAWSASTLLEALMTIDAFAPQLKQ